MRVPLAEKMRPKTIDDIVGQDHILNKNNPLYKMINNRFIPNLILYGPCGTGKTSFSKILSNYTEKKYYKINATNASFEDLKKAIENKNNIENTNGIILYIDEIHNLNKRQQQYLSEFLENGEVTLIASTTENPYYNIFHSIISRCTILEFKEIQTKDIEKIIENTKIYLEQENKVKIIIEDKAKNLIINLCSGDLRKAINILEICFYSNIKNKEINITKSIIRNLNLSTHISYDKDSNYHYDLLSAFQKSIRGSDIDAALYYLAILIKSNDLQSICRRLLVIASEDIGLAYPCAISIVKDCVDSANFIGFPEAKIPLSQAVIFLSSLPKSNTCITAINNALKEIEENGQKDIPNHLKYGNDDYIYPYDYKNNYVKQQYMPNEIKSKCFYEYGNNKFETSSKNYWNRIKNM